jgi:hypothetical protein
MKNLFASVLFGAALGTSGAFAAAPATAPAGSTGLCKDGTYSVSTERKSACRGHQGMKKWYGDQATIGGAPANTVLLPAEAGMGSGNGKVEPEVPLGVKGGLRSNVWADTSTKVYHCSGDKLYGTTKHGKYMSEADAKSKGFRADHGKACSTAKTSSDA